jgi:hypothetical protein
VHCRGKHTLETSRVLENVKRIFNMYLSNIPLFSFLSLELPPRLTRSIDHDTARIRITHYRFDHIAKGDDTATMVKKRKQRNLVSDATSAEKEEREDRLVAMIDVGKSESISQPTSILSFMSVKEFSKEYRPFQCVCAPPGPPQAMLRLRL